MEYRWTTLGEVDPKQWADLIRVIADADGNGEYYEAEDLAEELADTNVDVETDTIIAVLDGDELVAWASSTCRPRRSRARPWCGSWAASIRTTAAAASAVSCSRARRRPGVPGPRRYIPTCRCS
jgi:hypothetical protein